MGRLEGKIALITGAARGIGQAISFKFAREGADLALCDLEVDWLEETKSGVTEIGTKAAGFSADVSQADQVAAAVKAVQEEFGRIDILVNNAGITKDGFLARMSEADWDAVLNINLKGSFLFTKTVSKLMMKQRSGAIVNIASIIGLIGNAGQCNYAASKAGLIALTKSTAKELAGRGIRANAVAPGFIKTAMTDALSEDIREKMLENIPSGRFGGPEEVADVVAYLASEEAGYVNGQVLSVCGGMVTA
jgi:3-oxoacyl-[acyl-carrier protein] reductase